MPKIVILVQDFLAQKNIAVVGVSEKRESGCNLAYDKFKEAGCKTYPVNPHISSYHGETCYPDLKSIPVKPGAVFIFTNPGVTEEIVQQCIDLGVGYVWMHCMMGTKPGAGSGMSSVSSSAVQMCREHGIQVIPGSCPNQYIKPDPFHGFMRKLWGVFGFLPAA